MSMVSPNFPHQLLLKSKARQLHYCTILYIHVWYYVRVASVSNYDILQTIW
jgi:hypothetical protein